ncbi:MAG: site-2 protease family protein [Myxococcales bacterium FL481]|nr:MAG: site-2 protease family protein [Myxococcales bacterium FL481]
MSEPSPKDAKRPGRVARIAGIDVYIHWTFGLLVAWILFRHLDRGDDLVTAIDGVVFVLAIFACVVLHELGHALTARRFGIRTRDITLYPIGGVARLERMPERSLEEFLVAIAGPAVNLVIAGGLIGVLAAGQRVAGLLEFDLIGGDFLVKLAQVNVVLAVFNLVPAFPMDGGRVLRALLALRFDHARATKIAATAGRVMAVGFGIVGYFFNPMLILIAVFVFVGAHQEAQAAHAKSLLLGIPVAQAMITEFHALDVDDPLDAAVQALLASDQKDFPVIAGANVAGMLSRDHLLRALARGPAGDVSVGSAMSTKCEPVHPHEMLDDVFARMQQAECQALPVLQANRLVGLVTLENIAEWMMVANTRTQAAAPLR